MGNLKPGATYIYERNGDEIYAREFGETDRTLIGYDHKIDPRTSDGRPLFEHMKEELVCKYTSAPLILLCL